MKSKARDYVITITVKSPDGKKPEVRTICGDTIFVNLVEDQTARWTIKRKVKKL